MAAVPCLQLPGSALASCRSPRPWLQGLGTIVTAAVKVSRFRVVESLGLSVHTHTYHPKHRHKMPFFTLRTIWQEQELKKALAFACRCNPVLTQRKPWEALQCDNTFRGRHPIEEDHYAAICGQERLRPFLSCPGREALLSLFLGKEGTSF